MKVFILFFSVFVLLSGGYLYLRYNDEIKSFLAERFTPEGNVTLESDATSRYTNSEGFSFVFPSSSHGYLLKEFRPSDTAGDVCSSGVLLIPSDDYHLLESGSAYEANDPPPSITVMVCNNTENLSPRAWAVKHTSFTKITVANPTPTEVTFDDHLALRYDYQGRYLSQVYMIAREEKIYYFLARYAEEDSPIYADFFELLGTVRFTTPLI